MALPVSGDLASHVHAGWRLAAVHQASPDWAAALLTSGTRHPQTLRASSRPAAAWPADDQLAAVLPPAARAARVAALLSRTTVTPAALAELAACPGPWPVSLAEVVVSMLRTRGHRGTRIAGRAVLLGRDALGQRTGYRGGPQPARYRRARLRRRAEPAG